MCNLTWSTAVLVASFFADANLVIITCTGCIRLTRARTQGSPIIISQATGERRAELYVPSDFSMPKGDEHKRVLQQTQDAEMQTDVSGDGTAKIQSDSDDEFHEAEDAVDAHNQAQGSVVGVK